MTPDRPLKAQVRDFWEKTPLFAGESGATPGTREYFLEHEAVYLSDVFPGGRIDERFFPFPAGAMVLDVGCGPGFWTRQLARRGYATSAVDLTDRAVDLTRASLAIFDLAADVRQGDAEALPFADATFDGVVSHGVIHHTPNTATCVKEIARVLKPGGQAVVSVYYKNFVLRSPSLARLAAKLLARGVSLPGRGRDELLASGDPAEIVRLYDGRDNPLGKSFTQGEFARMFEDAALEARSSWLFYFPLRAFGGVGRVLKPIHSTLIRGFGLMIVVNAGKPHREGLRP
jgi:SAM-dependent methyltransferase